MSMPPSHELRGRVRNCMLDYRDEAHNSMLVKNHPPLSPEQTRGSINVTHCILFLTTVVAVKIPQKADITLCLINRPSRKRNERKTTTRVDTDTCATIRIYFMMGPKQVQHKKRTIIWNVGATLLCNESTSGQFALSLVQNRRQTPSKQQKKQAWHLKNMKLALLLSPTRIKHLSFTTSIFRRILRLTS